jgi:transcriptional regulator NrdR family protein
LKGLLVQTGKRLEPFSRDKLFITVRDSLNHRKTATSDATALTDTIIGRLYPHISSGMLNRSSILQSTELVLKRFDKTAAVYYAAYHPV